MVIWPALLWPLLAKLAGFGRCTRHAGSQDHAHLRAVLANGLCQLEARPIVSFDVEKREVELHLQAKSLRGFLGRPRLDDLVAAFPEISGKRGAHEDVAVNEQQNWRFRRS